jgi:hypothetical protein
MLLQFLQMDTEEQTDNALSKLYQKTHLVSLYYVHLLDYGIFWAVHNSQHILPIIYTYTDMFSQDRLLIRFLAPIRNDLAYLSIQGRWEYTNL